MIAICQIRPQPQYRRDAFVSGLTRAGYKIVESGKPSSNEDLLVIWNRYGAAEAIAKTWESCGGTVIVCENGYAGRDKDGHQYYAMGVHGHNGSGWFPIGDEDRFAKLNLRLNPMREIGEHMLICGQRGIGSKIMASPANWHTFMQQKLEKVTDHPIKVRLHPGNQPAKVPLEEDLLKAYACYIWSSGAGVKALQFGIPVAYDAPYWICEGAATKLGQHMVPLIPTDEQRMEAFRKMAWGQRSIEEIESGEPFATFRERIAECPKW